MAVGPKPGALIPGSLTSVVNQGPWPQSPQCIRRFHAFARDLDPPRIGEGGTCLSISRLDSAPVTGARAVESLRGSGGLVNDFWEECVTLRPSQRPRPQDLASHACMAQPDLVSAAGVWTVRGDANLYSRDDEAPPEAASQPQRYLQSMGISA